MDSSLDLTSNPFCGYFNKSAVNQFVNFVDRISKTTYIWLITKLIGHLFIWTFCLFSCSTQIGFCLLPPPYALVAKKYNIFLWYCQNCNSQLLYFIRFDFWMIPREAHNCGRFTNFICSFTEIIDLIIR